MKTGKTPFIDASTLNAKLDSLSGALSAPSIAKGIAKSLQEIFAKLPPLNILTVGSSNEECVKQLHLLFGLRYFVPDHKQNYKTGVTRYQQEKHPLCIYQTEIHSDAAVELSKCLSLIRTCGKEPKTALNLLIFCAGDDSGQLEEWEQRAMVQLLMEEIPLLVMLRAGASAEMVEQVQCFLEDEVSDGHYLVNAGTQDLCACILALLEPEPQERGKIRAKVHEVKTKVWPDASVQNTFVHLERLDYELKAKSINALINVTSTATSAKAAVPICPDAVLMAPLEAAMMAGITAYFEVKVSGRLIKTLIPAVLSTGTATVMGKLVAGALKYIPIGLPFNALTAWLLTQLIGRSYYLLLLAIEQNEISEEELGSGTAIEKLEKIMKTAYKNAGLEFKLPFKLQKG